MRWLTLLVIAVGVTSVSELTKASEVLYEQFTLDNGLKIILNEDRTVPVVSISIRYHVGSKDESSSQYGMAHLFEHLMYRGSENFHRNFHDELTTLGATSHNAYTSTDETHFFETVPAETLERVLWMESDRMGYLLGAVTQDALDTERTIIQAEKSDREAAAGAKGHSLIFAHLFPEGHPYQRMPIGSMAALNAMCLNDVRSWYKRHYGPNNAVISLSGDIDIPAALRLVGKYFGDIPAAPDFDRLTRWAPAMTENKYISNYDTVSLPVIERAWVVPSYGERQEIMFRLIAGYLRSRMESADPDTQRDSLQAIDIETQLISLELASVFVISVAVQDEDAIYKADRTLDRILANFLQEGPQESRLNKIKNDFGSYVTEKPVGTRVTAEQLSQGALFTDNPGYERQVAYNSVMSATPGEIRDAAQKWLGQAYVQLTTYPVGRYKTAESQIDRSHAPAISEEHVVLKVPEVQETLLVNGLTVVLAERHDTPTINMAMVFNAGRNAEVGHKPYASVITNALMGSHGPQGLSSDEFQKKLNKLAMGVGAESDNYTASILTTMMKDNLTESLQMFASIITEPAFQKTDVEQTIRSGISALEPESSHPIVLASRILSEALYGIDHPNATDWHEKQKLEALELEDVTKFFDSWVRPDNATLFVIGDITLEEISADLEVAFSHWARPDTPLTSQRVIQPAHIGIKPRFILVDRPNSNQTTIVAGRLVPAPMSADDLEIEAVTDIFSGGIGSRLSNSLRTDKGWAYSVDGRIQPQLDQRMWRIITQVQDKFTVSSVEAILSNLKALCADRPVTDQELEKYKAARFRGLVARFETPLPLFREIARNRFFGYPANYFKTLPGRLNSLSLSEVNRVACETVLREPLVMVLIGNVAQYEEGIRGLAAGDVELWRHDIGR